MTNINLLTCLLSKSSGHGSFHSFRCHPAFTRSTAERIPTNGPPAGVADRRRLAGATLLRVAFPILDRSCGSRQSFGGVSGHFLSAAPKDPGHALLCHPEPLVHRSRHGAGHFCRTECPGRDLYSTVRGEERRNSAAPAVRRRFPQLVVRRPLRLARRQFDQTQPAPQIQPRESGILPRAPRSRRHPLRILGRLLLRLPGYHQTGNRREHYRSADLSRQHQLPGRQRDATLPHSPRPFRIRKIPTRLPAAGMASYIGAKRATDVCRAYAPRSPTRDRGFLSTRPSAFATHLRNRPVLLAERVLP